MIHPGHTPVSQSPSWEVPSKKRLTAPVPFRLIFFPRKSRVDQCRQLLPGFVSVDNFKGGSPTMFALTRLRTAVILTIVLAAGFSSFAHGQKKKKTEPLTGK